MYYTGIDPMTGEEVYVAKTATERRIQRALLQFWKPENYADVRRALEQLDRTDLIGNDPDCLIPSRPPALPKTSRKGKAGRASTDNPSPAYRPHRKTARRRLRP